MLFHSYKPGPHLSDFIENFWLYDGYASTHLKERTFPSGTFELVFNLRDDELRIYKATNPDRYTRFSGAVVSGPYEGYFVTDRGEEVSVMGVHFRPGGGFPFLGFAADELTDTHINLRDIWGRAADDVHERLSCGQSPTRRFRILEKELLSRLFRPLGHHPAVAQSLEGLCLSTSRSLVRNVVREAGISERRFIDVFNFEVGLKPKLFARIQRFQRVLRIMHRNPAIEWGNWRWNTVTKTSRTSSATFLHSQVSLPLITYAVCTIFAVPERTSSLTISPCRDDFTFFQDGRWLFCLASNLGGQ